MAPVHLILVDPALLHAEGDPRDVVISRRNCWIPIIVGTLAAGAALVAPLYGVLAFVVVTPILGAAINRLPLPRLPERPGDGTAVEGSGSPLGRDQPPVP